MPHLPVWSVALMDTFPVGLSNLLTKKYDTKIKKAMLALMGLIRTRSEFLFKSNITRVVYGLSSLISIPFLLRPCTFNKSLLLGLLLCTSYI